MTRNLTAALIFIAVVTTGCGGGSSDSDSDSSSSSRSTSASDVTNPADQAIAEKSLLVLDDFPAGWEATPSESDAEDQKRRIAKCVGVKYKDLYGGSSGNAESKSFDSSDDESVSNSVRISPDESTMADAFKIAAGPKYPKCLRDSAQKLAEKLAKDEEDMKVGDASLNELSFDDYGDENLAFRLTIPFRSQGISADLIVDYVLVRVGRATTLISAQSIFTAFDVDELSRVTKIAVDRLTSGLKQG